MTVVTDLELIVRSRGGTRYSVSGGRRPHDVDLAATPSCDCEDHQYRQHACKHLRAVMAFRAEDSQGPLLDAMSEDDLLDALGPPARARSGANPYPKPVDPLMAPGYVLTGGPLSAVQPEAVRWLWPGRVPAGKLTILDGDPGLGKSTLALDLAARVSRGLPMPDGSPTTQGAVLLFTAEDGLADTVRPRLDALGADVAQVYAYDGVRREDVAGSVTFPAHVDALAERIAALGGQLVIVDPLVCYLHGALNTRVDSDMRQALAPLARVAEQTGAAIVVIRHLNKSAGAAAIYRGGGSIGIIGAARSALLVARDPEDEERRVLAVVKSNLASLAPSLGFALVGSSNGAARVEWLGESAHLADALLAIPTGATEHGELDEAADFLRAALGDGERTVRDVETEARAAGIAERTLNRARRAVGVSARRVGGVAGRGTWVLSLPTKAASGTLREGAPIPASSIKGAKAPLGGSLNELDSDVEARVAMRDGA